MSTYKLYYFNGRGRAEISRLIFAVAGQKYEDIRYEGEQWPEHKSEMPLGQMPVLEFDGTKLPQSVSIARFLAKQFQLAGKDNFEQAKVDAVVDTIGDLLTKFVAARWAPNESERDELIKKFVADEVAKHFKNLDILGKLYGNGGAFFVGNHLTWADLLFYDFGETLLGLDGDCLNNFPWLKQNRAEVAKQPKVAEHIKNRSETPF
ncbi:unnamed protein product [Rotaria socialis]|uniref:glutathione transferase n=1 Tax=Rotaria socialis TaxID=392032 RepID=A0A818QF15_9BILA|nr:unnamed protein product [Rotaria socialis]CAF3523236.1 unnamed protein product [Rotaria socialis]CAF3534113.1 unnamed protein product [Rotaria socialis]CAF3598858.1 unnamed protein product [Rotaria socialis]CAF3633697.1 unnamed protein product [Rotaria socialis]